MTVLKISGISNIDNYFPSRVNPVLHSTEANKESTNYTRTGKLEKNESFVSTFPKQELLPENIFPFFDTKDRVANFLTNIFAIQDSFAQYNVSQVRGEPRPTNELRRYLEYPSEKIKDVAMSIVDENDSSDEKMYKIEQWVIENFEYTSDIKNYSKDEYWATPSETLRKGSGDCVAHYEEIWTKKGLKKVSNLKVGDKVLSYDFNNQKYCYKPITKIWEKGKLPVYRIRFRNGTWFDVTEDHPFWNRRTQKRGFYEKTKLKDIDLSKWWKRKVPCVTKFPYKVKDIKWLTEDLCFVIGHYLAEGWSENSHVCSSGHESNKITPILEKHNIPFSLGKNGNGVPIINFLKAEFKHKLKKLGTNSFNMHLPKKLYSLPKKKLQAILDGYFLGDGHYSAYDNDLYKSNKEKTYSTSSYQLAYDLQNISLRLGKPLYMWLQENHGGVGDKPIWRLSLNTNSRFIKDFGFKDLSEVSIKDYKYIGEEEVFDFEVKNTHTFVNKFGIICHNCEDGSFLIHSLGLNAGVDQDRLRTYGGLVVYENEKGGIESGGHGWTAYKRESDDQWVVLDFSFFTTDKPIDKRMGMEDDFRYFEDWFFVNAQNTVDTPYSNAIRNPDRHSGYVINTYA